MARHWSGPIVFMDHEVAEQTQYRRSFSAPIKMEPPRNPDENRDKAALIQHLPRLTGKFILATSGLLFLP
jgi:hypothetical protein